MEILNVMKAIDKTYAEGKMVTQQPFYMEDYLAVYRAIQDYAATKPEISDMTAAQTVEIGELAVKSLMNFVEKHIITASLSDDFETPLQIKHPEIKVLARIVKLIMPPQSDLVSEIIRWG